MDPNVPPPPSVPFWDRTVTVRIKPRHVLASALAVGLAAAVAAGGWTGYTRFQEQKRLGLAQARVAEEFARLEPKARTQLQWLQDRLASFQNQLAKSRKATRSSSISLSSHRETQNSLQGQLDAAKQTLGEIGALNDKARAEFNLPSSADLLTSAQRGTWQELVSEQDALENQLQQVGNDFAALQDHQTRLAQNEAAAAARAKAIRERQTAAARRSEHISGYSPYSYEDRGPAYRSYYYSPYYYGYAPRYRSGVGFNFVFH